MPRPAFGAGTDLQGLPSLMGSREAQTGFVSGRKEKLRWRADPLGYSWLAGAAVVLGGRGTYMGTVAGVILITLIQSILSVAQPQHLLAEIGRNMLAEGIR